MKGPRFSASHLSRVGSAFLILVRLLAWAGGDEDRQEKVSFGDVLERELPAPGYITAKQFVLNFDNGEVLAMPTNMWKAGVSFSPRPSYNWMVKKGADLLVHSSEVSAKLSFHLDDGRLAILGTNVSFETIDARDVNGLAQGGVFQHLEIPRPQKGQNTTLVFKTREGGLGVMQLLEFTAKPEPLLKLRYKLVRDKKPRT